MALKTYMLLDWMHPKMNNLYVRVNKDQRIRKDKLPAWRPYLQMTFTDEQGQNRTIRYKANTSEIFQDAQIKQGILANEKTLMSERDDVEFINGTLTTGNPTVQKYIETYPGYDGFKGYCNDIRRPQYKIYDADKEIDSDNSDFLKRLKVGQMVAGLDLKGAQDLLIRLNGSSYILPDKLNYAQNALVKYMNEADEAELDKMLETTMTDDEKAVILIGKLINAGIIVFDHLEGQVIKKKGSREIVVKNIAADNVKEQQRLFTEYITSDAGKALYQDLENDLKTAQDNLQAIADQIPIGKVEFSKEITKDDITRYEDYSKSELLDTATDTVKPKENGETAVVKKYVARKKKKPKKRPKPMYSAKPKPVMAEQEVVSNDIHEPVNIEDHGM